jgi:chemotaxis signal transduction protein
MSLHGQSKAAPAGETFERLLVFASGAVKLALSAPLVEGMLPLGEAGIKDVVNVRGITYRVTPLAGRWEGMPSPATPKTLLLMCGYRGQHYGFTVDQVLGLAEVAPQQVRPLPPHFVCEERTWFNGFFLFRGTIALWVNPDWLLAPGKSAAGAENLEDTALGDNDGPCLTGDIIELEVIDAERAE